MDPLIIIVLVITAKAQASSATACNLSQKNGSHQCYGALGDNFSLRLIEDGSNQEILLNKATVRILNFKSGVTGRNIFTKQYVNRSIFVNGTFVLNGLMRNDSGDYESEIFHSNGTLFTKVNMQLEIQVPVSEPLLSHFCLPNRESITTCISEGDDLLFTWAINSQILNSGVAYNSVKLKNNIIGELTCIVQNKVSSHNSTIYLPACQDVSSQFLFLAVTLAVALAVATLTVILIMFNHRRKKHRSRCDSSESCNNADVVYVDVKINSAKKQPSASEKYVYEQITMAVNPDQAASP